MFLLGTAGVAAQKSSMADADSLHEPNSGGELGFSDAEADAEDDETSIQRLVVPEIGDEFVALWLRYFCDDFTEKFLPLKCEQQVTPENV